MDRASRRMPWPYIHAAVVGENPTPCVKTMPENNAICDYMGQLSSLVIEKQACFNVLEISLALSEVNRLSFQRGRTNDWRRLTASWHRAWHA